MDLNTIADGTQDWLDSVPPEFLFLLILPFLIGFAGLWAERRAVADVIPSKAKRVGVPAGFATALGLLAVAVD